jgi:hypothetical protein
MLVTIIILSVGALMLLQGKLSGRLVATRLEQDRPDENDQPSADRDTVGVLKNKIPVPDARPFLVPVLDVETLTTKDTLKSKES